MQKIKLQKYFPDASERKSYHHRIPKLIKEVIKSADTRGVSDRKTAEDSIKRIVFNWADQSVMEVTLNFQGKQIRTMNVGRSTEFRTEYRIPIFHKSIGIVKIKNPEMLNNILGATSDGIWAWIIFTKILNNKVLIGGITAGINM